MTDFEMTLKLLPSVIVWMIIGISVTGLVVWKFSKKKVNKRYPIEEKHFKDFNVKP